MSNEIIGESFYTDILKAGIVLLMQMGFSGKMYLHVNILDLNYKWFTER